MLAGQPVDRIVRMDHHGKGVSSDDGFADVFACRLSSHLFAELDGARSHGQIGRAVQQCGNSYAATSAGDGDAGFGVDFHEFFGCLLGDGQYCVAALDALGVEVAEGKKPCGQNKKNLYSLHFNYCFYGHK